MTTESVEEQPLIEIAASSGWRALDLPELFQFRELLGVMVWRDIKVRYRQTLLGVIWVVVQPLLTMVIFTVLFNRVAKIDSGNVPYSLFVMAALVPWSFFSAAVAAASNSLIGSAHLISKVYFPRMIVPASAVAGGLMDMAVTLAIVLVMGVWYGTPLTPWLLFLPVVALLATLFAFGCGLWLSALNVEYRDVRVVVPFLLQIWMYVTPVAYPASVLPRKFRFLVDANPMTGVIEAFRASILGAPMPWAALGYSTLFTAIVVVTGAFYFRRVERQFADVL